MATGQKQQQQQQQQQPKEPAKHSNYKGFVAGIFSGIAKLVGKYYLYEHLHLPLLLDAGPLI